MTMILRVLTPEGLHMQEEATAIRAPGTLGYLGVLRNHAPLVTTIQPGKLTWKTTTGESHGLLLESGLMEVMRNQVTLLVDRARPFDSSKTRSGATP